MITRQGMLTIEGVVFVNLDASGKPEPHGYTEITYQRDRTPTHHLTDTLQQDWGKGGTHDGGARVDS
jgi:hypothetical protein